MSASPPAGDAGRLTATPPEDEPAGEREWSYSHVDTVRFADLDPMRHLNNVSFLQFFENARIKFISSVIGDRRADDLGDFGLIFAECHINYRAPAFYDESIRTYVRAGEVRRSSFRVHFLMRSERDGRTLAEGWGAIVGYDYTSGRARPLPDSVREALAAAGAGTET